MPEGKTQKMTALFSWLTLFIIHWLPQEVVSKPFKCKRRHSLWTRVEFRARFQGQHKVHNVTGSKLHQAKSKYGLLTQKRTATYDTTASRQYHCFPKASHRIKVCDIFYAGYLFLPVEQIKLKCMNHGTGQNIKQ